MRKQEMDLDGWPKRPPHHCRDCKVQCGECWENADGYWDTRLNGLLPLCASCAKMLGVDLLPLYKVLNH